MTVQPVLPRPRHYLLHRSVLTLVVAYILALGATYNGILLERLQIVSMLLLTMGAAFWTIRRRSCHPQTALDPALALWAAAYAVSALTNMSARVGIGLWYAGLYAGIWFILSDLRRRGLPGRWLTDAALLTSIPLLILALAQVVDWFPAWVGARQGGIEVAFVPPRPPSSLGNPNAFGSVITMLLPLGLVRVRWSARRQDRVLWALWLMFALVTLVLTSSRGAWLGAGTAVALMGLPALHNLHILAWWRHGSRRTRWGLVGVVILLLLVLLRFSLDVFDTPRRGTSERQALYRVALETFLEYPLTGTGPFTFGRVLLEKRSVPPEQPHVHAHNLILNTAAELGLLGVMALGVSVALIIQRVWLARRNTRDPAERSHLTACGAALAAFGVHGLVDMPMMIPAVMLLMLGILAAGISNPNGDASAAESINGLSRHRLSWQRLTRLVAQFVPVGLWLALLMTGWWSAGIYADYIEGEQLLVDGQYRQAAGVLQRAAEAQPFNPLYHAEHAYAWGMAASAGDEAALEAGIEAYQRALARENAHAVWWANLGALYWQNGQPALAIEAMQRAARYAPEEPVVWLNLGLYYEEQGRVEQAAEAYRTLLAIQPRWGHAPFWSRTPLRRAVLASNPVEATPYMRAQMLWEQGHRDAARAEFDPVIARDPTQPGPYYDMARLYIGSGELERAQDYLDAGWLLNHNALNQAWWYAVRAELARAAGDRQGWQTNLDLAAELVLPDKTGKPLYLYGRDIANLHFLRLKVRGTWLPQIHTLGPDPILISWLEDAYSVPAPD